MLTTDTRAPKARERVLNSEVFPSTSDQPGARIDRTHTTNAELNAVARSEEARSLSFETNDRATIIGRTNSVCDTNLNICRRTYKPDFPTSLRWIVLPAKYDRLLLVILFDRRLVSHRKGRVDLGQQAPEGRKRMLGTIANSLYPIGPRRGNASMDGARHTRV